MFVSLLEYGSVVIDVNANRLDALELRNDANLDSNRFFRVEN